MKTNTNSKAAVTSILLLSLAAGLGTASGNITWAAAGILGLAALAFSGRLSQPKLALVRVRSQRKRS